MRFSAHVFPGETLETRIWATSDTLLFLFSVLAKERDTIVISNGYAKIRSQVKAPEGESSGGDVKAIFKGITGKIDSMSDSDREGFLKTVNAGYAFDIKDHGTVYLILRPGEREFVRTKKSDASVSLALSADTLSKLLSNKLSTKDAYMKGLVRMTGKMGDAMKLDTVISKLNM